MVILWGWVFLMSEVSALALNFSTRWSTTLPPKVNLPHAIDFKEFRGAVTPKLRPKLGGTKPS